MPNVSIETDDRAGLERLCRYILRSSFSLRRLRLLPDGRVRYKLKRPWGTTTELLMEPLELLRRLARLIPPPRMNLLRYFGALSPNSALRDAIIPKVPQLIKKTPTCDHAETENDGCLPLHPQCSPTNAPKPLHIAETRSQSSSGLQLTPLVDEKPEFTLGVRDRYLDWSSLLQRIFGDDIANCPRCDHGPLKVIAAIDDPPLLRKILTHLGLPTERPTLAPARSPPQCDAFADEDFDQSIECDTSDDGCDVFADENFDPNIDEDTSDDGYSDFTPF